MKTSFYPFFLLLLLTVLPAAAQQSATKESTVPAALSKQFNGLKERSNSYREGNHEYKVVSVNALESFWKSVQQTISATEQGLIGDKKTAEAELAKARQTIEAQQSQLQALQLDNENKDKQVQQSQHDVNSLSVLGIDMQKKFYVILTGVIILALIALLLIGMQQYKRNKLIAVEKENGYHAIEQELNECRKKARERELKIKRDLQTEMNLREELTLELERLKKHQVYKD